MAGKYRGLSHSAEETFNLLTETVFFFFFFFFLVETVGIVVIG